MKFCLGLMALLLSSLTFASNYPIDESFKVLETSSDILEMLKKRPELTIDHLSAEGFELYGPRGLETFLKKHSLRYERLDNANNFMRSEYPTPEAVEKNLKTIAQNYPGITKLYSIGKSVKKRDLWVMKLSRNARVDDNRPEFKYIANMHGDEIVGREVMIRFIKDCTENYGIDPRITNLLDKFQIHILVSMNPDGAALSQRGNGNRMDLNRDFPDFSTSDNQDNPGSRQPETQAVMKWQGQHKFRLSANFHGGAEVVNYPWDTVADPFREVELVKDLSHEYAQNAPYIGASSAFENGITNGFAWYEVDGGMQDWSIYWRSDLQLTIELSNSKWPDYSRMDYYYEQNRPALIKFIERIETLVKR